MSFSIVICINDWLKKSDWLEIRGGHGINLFSVTRVKDGCLIEVATKTGFTITVTFSWELGTALDGLISIDQTK